MSDAKWIIVMTYIRTCWSRTEKQCDFALNRESYLYRNMSLNVDSISFFLSTLFYCLFHSYCNETWCHRLCNYSYPLNWKLNQREKTREKFLREIPKHEERKFFIMINEFEVVCQLPFTFVSYDLRSRRFLKQLETVIPSLYGFAVSFGSYRLKGDLQEIRGAKVVTLKSHKDSSRNDSQFFILD
jgi:hypothetical protein